MQGAMALSLTNPWDTELGRLDAEAVGPNKVPGADASVEEITTYFLALNAKPGADTGLFAPKPMFWEKVGKSEGSISLSF